MRRIFIPVLKQKPGVDMGAVIYQQVRATPHCSNASLEYLHCYFLGNKLISVLRTTLGLHILQTCPYGLFSVGIPTRQGLC